MCKVSVLYLFELRLFKLKTTTNNNNNNNKMKNCKNMFLLSGLADMHIPSGYLVVVTETKIIINPRRAYAARVTVVGPCVCVSVHGSNLLVVQLPHGLSIVVAPELIWHFSASKRAIAFPYLRAHGSRPFSYAKRVHFPHSFRILRS